MTPSGVLLAELRLDTGKIESRLFYLPRGVLRVIEGPHGCKITKRCKMLHRYTEPRFYSGIRLSELNQIVGYFELKKKKKKLTEIICPKNALRDFTESILFVRFISSSIHSFIPQLCIELFLCSRLFHPRRQCSEQKTESPDSTLFIFCRKQRTFVGSL